MKLSGIYTAMKCGAVVVDVGGDEELERLMVDLSRKLSSKCCTGEIVVIVKSVVAKKEKLNEFKKWLSGSMKEVKRNEEGKIYMVREKSRRQTKMEKVLKLVEKMNFVVMVHSEYSYKSLERCCNEKNRPLDDIFTRILFMYEERRSWMMKEKIERRKEGSKGGLRGEVFAEVCMEGFVTILVKSIIKSYKGFVLLNFGE